MDTETDKWRQLESFMRTHDKLLCPECGEWRKLRFNRRFGWACMACHAVMGLLTVFEGADR